MMQTCVFVCVCSWCRCSLSSKNVQLPLLLVFPTFIFSPNPFNSALPLESVSSRPPVKTGMCLCPAEEDLHSIQLLFKWRLSCDDLCGKDRGHSQSFLQASIKECLNFLPPPPPFSFAAATSSNTALRLPRSFLTLSSWTRGHHSVSFTSSVTSFCALLLFLSFFSSFCAVQVNAENKSKYFNYGDRAGYASL